MNENLPRLGPEATDGSGILRPYFDVDFVVADSSGNPYYEEHLDSSDEPRQISSRLAMMLKGAYDNGHRIIGEVHPLRRDVVNIQGDVEVYTHFPPECGKALWGMGVRILYHEDLVREAERKLEDTMSYTA